MPDIEAAIKYAAQAGKVGLTGYCWGGLLAFLSGAQGADAVVSYYGVGIEKRLGDAKNLGCPLMLHYAELDKFSPPEVIAQVRETFREDPRVTTFTYQADHAFARPGGHNYHHPSADVAGMRTLAFLVDRLVGKR